MKKTLRGILAVAITFGFIHSIALACEKKGDCKGVEGDCKGVYGKRLGMQDKFFKKIKLLHKFQKEVDLTKEQEKEVEKISLTLKKELILKNAEVEVLAIEIKSGLYQEEVDMESINNFIDKKYEIKKEIAKKVAAAMAEMKKVITKEQCEKLKGLKKESKLQCLKDK